MSPPFDPESVANAAHQAFGKPDPEPAPWPEPDMSLARAEIHQAPPWPPDVLPPFWNEWTANASETSGAPRSFVSMSLLAGAGGLLGNARWGSPWRGWAHPPAIDVALVGKPSSGKSPAIMRLQRILSRIEEAQNEDFKDRVRRHANDKIAAKVQRSKHEEEVKEAIKRGYVAPAMPDGAQDPEEPTRRRVYSTNPTIEKAGRMSAANPMGLILVTGEMAFWLSGMERYGGGGKSGASSDRGFWLQAFDGAPHTPDRVKDGDNEVCVPNLTWSILGGIQPDRVVSLLFSGDDDGLSARFIYDWPDPIPPHKPNVEPDDSKAFEALLRLRTIAWPTAPKPIELPFTDDAADLIQGWREIVAAMEEDASGQYLSWVGKLPGFAVRLATIIAHLEWCADELRAPPEAVSRDHALGAIRLLKDYTCPMALRVFGEAAVPADESDARMLARWILKQRRLPKILNARALRRMPRGPGIKDAARTEQALEALEDAGWVRRPPSDGKPGRPSKDWQVNPWLSGGNPQ